MKQIERWERPKSSRIYIHPYASERLITVYPDMKITDLDLKDIGMHFDQGSFGVHTLFGTEPDEAYMEKTVWKTPENGLPVYTMFNEDEENGCMITMTAFCSTDRRPYSYCEVSVTNVNTYAVKGTMGLLPRFNKFVSGSEMLHIDIIKISDCVRCLCNNFFRINMVMYVDNSVIGHFFASFH